MSETQDTEETSNNNAYGRHPARSRNEPSRHNSRDQGPNDRTLRSGGQRIPSSSPDRFDARLPRFQQPATAPVTSPDIQEATRLLSRESAQQKASISPPPRQAGHSAANPSLSSLRRRLGSAYPSPSPDLSQPRRRSSHDPTKRSPAIASASGRYSDAAPRGFTLAGPTLENTLAASQPFVDPGYADLNPAYDRRVNDRPLWGLGKPLPHVVRPGMVPSDEEYQEMQQSRNEGRQPEVSEGIALGRADPTFHTHQLVSNRRHLDDIRRDREIRWFENRRRQFEPSPTFSPLSRTRESSTAILEGPSYPHRVEETIVEEEEEQSYEQHQSQPDPLELELSQLRDEIAVVNRAKEEEHLENEYQDANLPMVYKEATVDKDYFHTQWSVIRFKCREFLAEFLGITMQYILGLCANLAITVTRGTAGVSYTGDWAWGLATMVAIYIGAGVSGGHFNPAISIMLSIYRGFPARKLTWYIPAHVLGAMVATVITFKLFEPGLAELGGTVDGRPHWNVTVHNFITYPRAKWVSHRLAFATEVTGAASLTISVLAIGDDRNSPPGQGMLAFIIGLLVALLGMVLGHQTGLALNPARDVGPRATMWMLGYRENPDNPAESLFSDWYCIKVAILGPITGSLLGAFIYDSLIFVGPESPVNYPIARYKRVLRRWWSRRPGFMRRRKSIKDDSWAQIKGLV